MPADENGAEKSGKKGDKKGGGGGKKGTEFHIILTYSNSRRWSQRHSKTFEEGSNFGSKQKELGEEADRK
jgi:hypothetical protein